MKNAMGSRRRFLSCLQIIIAFLVVFSIVTANSQGVLAKSKTTDLIEDIADNDPSKHPSGKDRNLERGKSQTQGKSESNPDGNGADKRRNAKDGAEGGTQGNGDFDDNNGCGNDNDFADDNNGNCGGQPKGGQPGPKPKPTPSPKLEPSPSPPVLVTLCHVTGSASNPFVTITVNDQGALNGHRGHLGDIIPAPAEGCPGPSTSPSPTPSPNPSPSPSPSPEVLGISTLPETGVDLLKYVGILALIPIGAALSRYKKGQLVNP